MKQTVKHSIWIEHEKSWEHLFHLLQVLQGIILEIYQIRIGLCEAMTFRRIFCKNIARIQI